MNALMKRREAAMTKDQIKNKTKENLQKNAYARKIGNQYQFLKKWDSGAMTGIECIEAIEMEGQIFRIDNDLINLNKFPPVNLPKST